MNAAPADLLGVVSPGGSCDVFVRMFCGNPHTTTTTTTPTTPLPHNVGQSAVIALLSVLVVLVLVAFLVCVACCCWWFWPRIRGWFVRVPDMQSVSSVVGTDSPPPLIPASPPTARVRDQEPNSVLDPPKTVDNPNYVYKDPDDLEVTTEIEENRDQNDGGNGCDQERPCSSSKIPVRIQPDRKVKIVRLINT